MKITKATLPGMIKQYCRDQGITYAQLGEKLGTPKRTIENWAQGHRYPDMENTIKLLSLLQK